MKDNKYQLIGGLPCNFRIVPLKYLLSNETNPVKVGPFGSQLSGSDFVSEETDYWVYNQRAVLDKNSSSSTSFISKEKYDSMKGFYVREKDILITTRGTIGKIFRIPKNHNQGILHPCIIRFRINENIILYDLLEMIFNNSDLIDRQINYKSNATTIDVIYSETLKNLYIPLPNMEVQKKIINFLICQCTEIDALNLDIKKQMEILEEYKKSVITEVVTKGLNNETKIRTENKFYSFLPISHICKRIKQCLNGMTDGTHGTYQRTVEGRFLLSAKNVFEDGLHIGENESLISESDYRLITKNGFPHKNDILFCCVGTIGRCMVYDREEPIAFQRSVLFMNCNQNIILPKMMYYCLRTKQTYVQERLLVNKSAQEGLYQSSVSEMYISFPKDIKEQKHIIDYLDMKCSEIDEVIIAKKQQLEILEKYKKSLIYEYVTGKKRVE